MSQGKGNSIAELKQVDVSYAEAPFGHARHGTNFTHPQDFQRFLPKK